MKNAVHQLMRPPDAVLCDCSPRKAIARRKAKRKSLSLREVEDVAIGDLPRQKSISRFIESIVRQVFDSQTRKSTDKENVTVANYSAASAQDIAPVHKPHPEPSSYQLSVNTSQPQQQPWVNGSSSSVFKLGRPSPDLWLHRGSPEAVSSPDPSTRSANHSPERQTVRLNGKSNHFVLPGKQLNYYETETESEEDEEQCSESEAEEDQSELGEAQQRARRLDQLGSSLAASCDFWYVPDEEEAEEEDEEEQENHYVHPSTSSDIASSCVFWSMNDPSESDGSNEEVTKTPETEIRRKSASPLVNFTLDLGASCEANVCIPREDDSEFEDESIWDEEWDEEITEEDEEGCPSIPTTNSAALNSVFWDMLDSDIQQELDIRKEILSATRVADDKPVLENGTSSSSSQELNETFTVRLRDSSTPVPEDSDENTAEFVMSNYSRREGSPMPDTEAASTSFTMRMGLVWLGSSKPPGSKSKPMGLPLPRTPPGGKATPTTANHSVAASKAQTADFDSSSGTSDGSINISKATKGIEETLRLDGKVLNNLLDEQYRPSPRKASSPTKKPPRQPLINYPRFYYPQGQPISSVVNDSALRRVCEVFKAFPNQQCEIDDMFEVCQAAGLPLYWKAPIFAALTKNEPRPATLMDFTVWWRAMTSVAHDEASRFVYTLTGGTRSHLLPADFHSLVMDIIHTHPGLGFYREAVEFHDKYRDVVVTRIFWNVARNWSGKITTEEIRRSDLLQAIRELQLDDDINKSLRYFSYEHFYVVYCKFFDLDTDHDMKIDRDDLATHSDGAIVPLVVERIFSGAVCRIARRKSNVEQIGLVEFTQFLLAEEDKAHRTR
ncbi:hypothetical protein WR25_09428 isoform E [Diploscapter pachys]|uniref:Uncharacterized protein n=1 Tax=Diploscapter pachys TaxID=2018661 RepID=A0A2A2LMF2_9BILA|nr:hypothetical protein WR25_09428 isoform A [Diploscapter pachys]PAV87318.1 hypothetical protein WR25_09428 isoform B [Diploscapter pachys]PAV87319.1 hypothetical protein WR25_09428 isoform C [Diploscapter pachys]PAV87320.1 hypothetical protein WR25_09428 isoform D [Diploscapter pachys]PAV87321.1 hypothetical protein WR25_09428 isoform E [Diploscapter pachys]